MEFKKSLSKKALEKLSLAQQEIFYKSGRIIKNVYAYNYNKQNKTYLNKYAIDYYYSHKLAKKKGKL